MFELTHGLAYLVFKNQILLLIFRLLLGGELLIILNQFYLSKPAKRPSLQVINDFLLPSGLCQAATSTALVAARQVLRNSLRKTLEFTRAG